jgi:hypothetical protein
VSKILQRYFGLCIARRPSIEWLPSCQIIVVSPSVENSSLFVCTIGPWKTENDARDAQYSPCYQRWRAKAEAGTTRKEWKFNHTERPSLHLEGLSTWVFVATRVPVRRVTLVTKLVFEEVSRADRCASLLTSRPTPHK